MARYLRVSIQGALPGGDVWSVNPVLSPLMPPFSATPEQLISVAQAVASVSPPTSLRTGISANGSITGARVEARSDAFVLEDVGEYVLPTPAAGTGAPSKANQSAIVFSLRTAGVGSRARGRMYWPGLGIALAAATGRLSSPSNTTLSTDAALYLKSLCTAVQGVLVGFDTWSPVVYSRVSGTSRQVTGVWVGDVLDTQRRRRDEVPENYARAVYPPP